MKIILLSILTLSSISSHAGTGGISGGSKNGKIRDTIIEATQNSDWKKLRAAIGKSFKHQIKGDSIFVGQRVSAFDVCIQGDSLKHLKKTPIYENRYVGKSLDKDHEKDGWTFVEVGKRNLVYPITYTRYQRECNNQGKRCRRVPVVETQELMKKIQVEEYVRTIGDQSERDIYEPIAEQVFEVPHCK